MTTKSPGETESIFASSQVAEKWQRGKAQRDEVNAPANEMMLDLANLRAGSKVLDVAAGTGDQTLLTARRVGPTGYVLATDLSASMLNVAAEPMRKAGLDNVDTRVMDARTLISTLTRSTRSYAGWVSCCFPTRSKRLSVCIV